MQNRGNVNIPGPQMLFAIIWVVKPRRMRRQGHAACMWDRSAYKVLVRRDPREGDH